MKESRWDRKPLNEINTGTCKRRLQYIQQSYREFSILSQIKILLSLEQTQDTYPSVQITSERSWLQFVFRSKKKGRALCSRRSQTSSVPIGTSNTFKSILRLQPTWPKHRYHLQRTQRNEFTQWSMEHNAATSRNAVLSAATFHYQSHYNR
jgi:hypothetical protein